MYKSHSFSCFPDAAPAKTRHIVQVPASNTQKSGPSEVEVIPGIAEVTFHLVKMLEIRVKLGQMTPSDLCDAYSEFDLEDVVAKAVVVSKEISAKQENVHSSSSGDYLARTETGFEFPITVDLLQYLANFLAILAENPDSQSQTKKAEKNSTSKDPIKITDRFWRLSQDLHGDLTVDQALYKTHLCPNMVRVLGYVVQECPKGFLCMDAHCECEQVTKGFHSDAECGKVMAEVKEKSAGNSNNFGENFLVSDEHLSDLIHEKRAQKLEEAENNAKGIIKTARASNQDNAFKTLLCRFHHDFEADLSGSPCPNQSADLSGLEMAEILALKKSGQARVCLYAHGHPELRFRPEDFLNFVSDNFKREPCKNLAEKGFCAHGKKCHFAHCTDELMFGRCTEVDILNRTCCNQYSPASPPDTPLAEEI